MSRTLIFCSLESDRKDYFRERLAKWSPVFCNSLADVPSSAEVLSIFVEDVITPAFLSAHPMLKLVVTRSTGIDHIDLHACSDAGVAVAHASDYSENGVAEHTFALMLSLTRRLRLAEKARAGGTFSREGLRGIELRGRTLGIIGAGRIGVRVAALGKAFGMRVLATDPRPNAFYSDLVGFSYVPLDVLLGESDIISLHAAVTHETHHILNAETLAKCREGVLIINTARGGFIDTKALGAAIESGQVGGAGLDVLENEKVLRADVRTILGSQIVQRLHTADPREASLPTATRREEIASMFRQNTLLEREEVVFTPHIAFNTVEAIDRIFSTTADTIEDYFCGRPLRHLVHG